MAEVKLGESRAGRESYDVTAEWDEDNQLVYVSDWNNYDGCYMAFIGLEPGQMERLVQWWRENH